MSGFDNMKSYSHPLKIYIGWDPREVAAYDKARESMIRHSSRALSITPLVLANLELAGVMRRPTARMKQGGQLWDVISGAPMSTEFANSRFAVPILAQSGWAAFFDPDVIVFEDVAELFELYADPDKALMCVAHAPLESAGKKMDGQLQVPYARKNWSSLMLFNCDHPKNRGLTLDLLNTRPGRDLHRFCWLDDGDIGYLPADWNWLVNVQPKPARVRMAHFTLGGPWLPNWRTSPYDDLWLDPTAHR